MKLPFLITKLSPADFVTLLNGAAGTLAILYLLDPPTQTNILMAHILILLGIAFDGLDGRIARLFGSKHSIGKYLDSFADFVTFCCAPSFLLYRIYYAVEKGSAFTNWENALVVLGAGLFVIMGIIRLAYYISRGEGLTYFEGIPTNGAAFVFLAFLNMFRTEWMAVVLFMCALAVVMVTNIPYPKLQSRSAFIVGSVGLLLGIFGPLMELLHGHKTLIDISKTAFLVGAFLYLFYPLYAPFFKNHSQERLEND